MLQESCSSLCMYRRNKLLALFNLLTFCVVLFGAEFLGLVESQETLM